MNRMDHKVCVIAGATRPEQIDANIEAGEWVLTPAQKTEVDAILDAA